MSFYYLKALHIIFIVTWFAGLFNIVRLFVHHTEAEKRPPEEKKILQEQYKKMERPLWYGITWPSMILTYTFGTWLVSLNYTYYFSSAWFILKLLFVFGLTLYHLRCQAMFRQFQKDIIVSTSLKLRIWNEVATIFLVAIVFIVVLKNTLSFIWGLLGLILFTGMLYGAIMIYKKSREKKNNP